MKDLNEKKWKRRKKCIRPNMALFWNQNISFSLSFLGQQKRREREKKKRREERKRRRRRREEKEERRSKVWNGIDYYGFIWISMVGMTISCYKPRV